MNRIPMRWQINLLATTTAVLIAACAPVTTTPVGDSDATGAVASTPSVPTSSPLQPQLQVADSASQPTPQAAQLAQPTAPPPTVVATPTSETLASPQQQIVIESPTAGAMLSHPFQLAGRVALTPFDKLLRYQVKDNAGALIGSGQVEVQGTPRAPGVFAAIVAYSATLPGFVRIEVIAPDGSVAIEAQTPNVTVNLQQGVSLNLNGVATQARGVIAPQVDNRRFPIDLNGAPEHLRVIFDNNVPSEKFDPRERQLLVLPLNDYRTLFGSADVQLFDETIQSLRTLLASRPATLGNYPFLLPASDLTPALYAQTGYLDFKNGSGVRTITHLTQEISPLVASSLIYTFQGLTSDDQYYIAAYVPISYTVLPATPADVSKAERDEFKKDYLAYLDRIVQTLNAQPQNITPPLVALDGMIQSLEVSSNIFSSAAPTPAPPTSGTTTASTNITGKAIEPLNIRSGPSTRFRAIGRLQIGEEAELLGRSADGDWIRVRATDGTLGWISRNYIESTFDLSTLPVVQ